MAAGNFRPRRGKSRSSWGEQRGSTGGMVSGWNSAINTWVDCRAFIWSYDGNVYDITDDIITGNLIRNTDTPTTMTITFANEGDKYRQMFIPNDRIVLWLRRNEKEWQSFTGYIHNTPIFNLYKSRELTIECSCIIRRLNQKFWDPRLKENIFILSGPNPFPREDPNAPEETPQPDNQEPAPIEGTPEDEGATANAHGIRPDSVDPNSPAPPTIPDAADPAPDNPPDDPTTPEDESAPPGETGEGGMGQGMNTPDMTLAFLLTAPDHVGLKPEMVLIQKFPQEWADRAAEISAKNTPCYTLWEEIIQCPDDKPQNCEEGGPGGTDGPLASGCPDGLTIGKVVEIWPEGEREFAAAVLWCESTGVASAYNGTPEGQAAGGPAGLFQIVPTTAQGVDPSATAEKLFDPLYNADIAHRIWDQQGWSPWECAVRPGGPGADAYGHENDPITGCPEGTSIANMDVNFQENAGEWLPHVQQVADIVQGKFGIPGSTYANHGTQPGGAATAIDFVMPSGWGSAATGSSLDIGNKLAGFLDANWEAFNIVYLIWQDQAKWSAGGGWEPYDEGSYGGGSGNINSQRHLDHVHASFSDVGTVGKYVDDGSKFNPGATPCGSGGNGEAHSDPESTAVENAIERSLKRELNQKLSTMISNSKELEGISFTWGGGHGKNLHHRKSDWGVDASGLFNLLRKMQGIEPSEIGSVSDYFKFLEGVEKFDVNREYPIGTILINPGSLETMGHMGMVVTRFGHVLEANATGRVMSDFRIGRSNIGWEGYTHVGYMPDIGRDESPMYVSHAKAEFDNKRHEVWLREYEEAQNRVYDKDEENPIIYCSTLPEDSGFVRIKEVNNWDTVGNDKKMYVRVRTKYASYINNGIAQWNGIGGVQILPSDGGRVDLDIYDGDRPDNVMATTSSAGWMEFDIARMDGATDNARQSVATHELGHALRLGHAPASEVSVMQPIINSGSSNNPDSPTEYDVAEYKSVWGGAGQPGGGATPEGGGGPQTSDVEVEPCITRHPLGVYKLASEAYAEAAGQSTLQAEVKRFLALNGGIDGPSVLEEAKDHIKKHFPENKMEIFPKLFEPCEERRDWVHLAELDKEPYMKTVQDVADAGMYTIMSLGTGEIVFWYPWYLGDLAPGVGLSDEERRKREDLLTASQIKQLQEQHPELKAYDLTGLTMEEVRSKWPEYFSSPAQSELEEPTDFSGEKFVNTNASVLSDKIVIEDIDLVDFSLYVTDDPLITHYYVLGDYRQETGASGGWMDLQCYRWSTIFDHPVILAQAKETMHFDPFAFIQRYGVRSKSDTIKAIKTPGFAQIYAEQQFLKQWFNSYLIQISTAYFPEIYPGSRVHIKPLGIEVVVFQASHTFGSQWTTNLTVSMPLKITDKSKIPPLPFWSLFTTEMVFAGLDPTRPISGADPSGLDTPFGTPLEISGDLWESIQRKRDADNERVRTYLNSWVEFRDRTKGIGFEEFDKLLKSDFNTPAPDVSNVPLTPDELGAVYERHPELRGQLEGLTRAQIRERFPQIGV